MPLADVLAVVGTNCRDACEVDCVGDADCERFVHAVCYLLSCEPGDLFAFGGGAWRSASDVAAEHEGNDALGHVLVDAGEGYRLDVQAGLFEDFAAKAVQGSFVQFEDAPWWFPVFVVPALDRQNPSVVGDDRSRHADRVARTCGHGLVLRPGVLSV